MIRFQDAQLMRERLLFALVRRVRAVIIDNGMAQDLVKLGHNTVRPAKSMGLLDRLEERLLQQILGNLRRRNTAFDKLPECRLRFKQGFQRIHSFLVIDHQMRTTVLMTVESDLPRDSTCHPVLQGAVPRAARSNSIS